MLLISNGFPLILGAVFGWKTKEPINREIKEGPWTESISIAVCSGHRCRDVTTALQALVHDGALIQQNPRRWASCRIADDSPQFLRSRLYGGERSPQYSPQLDEDSPQLPADSPQLDRLAGLSVDARSLLPLAEPARQNKKLSKDRLKLVIQQLCLGRWLSTSDLATLVDRDAEKLQSRFLTAMVRAGILELRYPEVRNRPDQAYRTVQRMADSTAEPTT